MFGGILIEITGGCNAKCPLCTTGRETFGQRIKFMSVPDFARTVDRLLELGLADPAKTVISLHNWGEPILHPDLNGIVATLNARKLRIGISTNASKKTSFKVPTDGFSVFTFSVPGWSQASYDKAHGLRFDHVVANMEAIMQNMRATGYKGRFTLSFHVYQFNVFEELEGARAWCAKHDVIFQPYYAYIADYEAGKAYLKGEMAREELDKISRMIFLHYIPDLVAKQPADWKCPQWEGQLTLNHKSQVLLCCALPDSHKSAVLGSVFELSRDEIVSLKLNSKECDDCLGCGLAYWGHFPLQVTAPGTQFAQKLEQANRELEEYKKQVAQERTKYDQLLTNLKSADAPRALRAVLPLARTLRQGYNLLRRAG